MNIMLSQSFKKFMDSHIYNCESNEHNQLISVPTLNAKIISLSCPNPLAPFQINDYSKAKVCAGSTGKSLRRSKPAQDICG